MVPVKVPQLFEDTALTGPPGLNRGYTATLLAVALGAHPPHVAVVAASVVHAGHAGHVVVPHGGQVPVVAVVGAGVVQFSHIWHVGQTSAVGHVWLVVLTVVQDSQVTFISVAHDSAVTVVLLAHVSATGQVGQVVLFASVVLGHVSATGQVGQVPLVPVVAVSRGHAVHSGQLLLDSVVILAVVHTSQIPHSGHVGHVPLRVEHGSHVGSALVFVVERSHVVAASVVVVAWRDRLCSWLSSVT